MICWMVDSRGEVVMIDVDAIRDGSYGTGLYEEFEMH